MRLLTGAESGENKAGLHTASLINTRPQQRAGHHQLSQERQEQDRERQAGEYRSSFKALTDQNVLLHAFV